MRDLRTAWMPIAALALGLVVAGCAGEDGKDGLNGLNGADGAPGPPGPPGTAECMQCHTDSWDAQDYILAIQSWFDSSQHNKGETYLRTGAGCARCHTNEGFQVYLATGTAPAQPSSSRIGCFTCHAPHTNRDFRLRKTGATAIDLGGTYDKGRSNTCAVCHQARVPDPRVEDVSRDITSARWGPHHSTQSNVLSASGAYVFAGATYPSSFHNAAISDGCLRCHMGPEIASSTGEGGGHSFKVRYGSSGTVNSRSCLGSGCHEGWTDATATTEVNEFQEGIHAKLQQIRTILVDKGWVNPDTGLLNASTTNPLILPVDDRGAIFNYYLIEEDFSAGVHNPRYANAVLDATLDYLTP